MGKTVQMGRAMLSKSLIQFSVDGQGCVPQDIEYKSLCYTVLLLLSLFSRVRLFATPRTVAYQAPPPMGFSRQEYWSGVPFVIKYDWYSDRGELWTRSEPVTSFFYFSLLQWEHYIL